MDPTSELLLALAKALGLSPLAVAFWIPVVIILCNRVAKLIPDNATGPLGWLRIAMAIIGIKVSNNTGVAPVQDSTGKVIERSEPSPDVPVADEIVKLATEGSAELTPEVEQTAVKQVFQLGAKALESQVSHEG